MYRFLWRPKWVLFHVAILASIIAMVSLSMWQFRRLDERRTFNGRVTANAEQSPVDFTALLASSSTLSAIEWRPVTIDGSYDPRQFVVVNRSQGGAAGSDVVGVVRLANGTAVIVNRGFVAGTNAPTAAPTGHVRVTGRVRLSEERRFGQGSDDPTATLTEIRRVDLAVLATQVTAPLAPMYVEAISTAPADSTTVQPLALPELSEGPHLSYAIQWIIFAICAAVGWVFAVRRSVAIASGRAVRRRRGSPLPIEDEPPKAPV